MSKKKDSLKPWLSRPTVNRSVTLPLTRPLTQRLSNLNEFHPNELDPYLLFDAQDSMIGTLENPTLDLDPSKPDTLNVITATRAGVATFTDVNGLIASAPANTVRVDQTQGAELTPTKFQRITNTEFDQWTSENATITANALTSPFGSQDASKLVATSSSQRQAINIVTNVSDSLVASVYAKKGEYDVLQITDARNASYFVNFDLTNGAVGSFSGVIGEIQDIGDGWYRCISKFTSSNDILKLRLSIAESSTQARLVNFAGNGTDGIYLYGPQLEEGTTASDFVANTSGEKKFISSAVYGPRVPMILVEPSATNLVPNSSSFENVNGSLQATGFEAPDGSNDAVKISNINGATDPMVAWSSLATLSPSNQYSGSIFVKGSAGESVRFYLRRAFGGAMANSPFLNVVLTGSWQRVEIGSMTTASDNNNGRVFIFQSSSGTPADEVYLWGSQLEQGAVSTSVIPTSGSTVTRAADDLVISGSDFSDFYNQSEGTVYTEFEPRDVSISNKTTLDFSNGTGTERILSLAYSSYHVYVVDGGVEQAHLDGGTYTAGAVNRLAFSYKANNIQVSVGGGAVVSDTSASIPTLDRLQIGASYANSSQLNGHIKRLIYWPYHSDNL